MDCKARGSPGVGEEAREEAAVHLRELEFALGFDSTS